MIKDDTCTEIFWNCIPNKVQSSSLTPTNIDQQTWFIFIYCLNLLLPIFFLNLCIDWKKSVQGKLQAVNGHTEFLGPQKIIVLFLYYNSI